MKVRDFIKREEDIDVYDNVCEELGIAFCGPLRLKKEGEEKFDEVLDYDIEINVGPRYSVAIIDIDKDDWERRLKKAKEFFYAAAGYCADEDYQKWFEEE